MRTLIIGIATFIAISFIGCDFNPIFDDLCEQNPHMCDYHGPDSLGNPIVTFNDSCLSKPETQFFSVLSLTPPPANVVSGPVTNCIPQTAHVFCETAYALVLGSGDTLFNGGGINGDALIEVNVELSINTVGDSILYVGTYFLPSLSNPGWQSAEVSPYYDCNYGNDFIVSRKGQPIGVTLGNGVYDVNAGTGNPPNWQPKPLYMISDSAQAWYGIANPSWQEVVEVILQQ